MASRQIFHAKPSYIYPTPAGIDTAIASESCIFEFDEADLWISSTDHLHHQATTVSNMEVRKAIPSSRSSKKLAKKMDLVGDHHHHNRRMPMASASLPVNIPDWSKILKDEYREHNKRESDEEGDDNNNNNNHNHNHHHHRDHEEDEYYGLVPPHEYLAMRRGASFSVHEGVGRTLKGRDLRRVRNAIWKKVGFED